MKIFTAIIFAFAVHNCYSQSNYCIPNPPGGIDGYSIDSVHLESLDTAFAGIVYRFIPDSVHHQTCYLYPGQTYRIYLKSGTQAVSTLGAWIDWNNDTTLASAEKLGEINTTTPNEVDYISFTVPQNCFKGKLRLRVRSSNSSSLNACNDYVSGQILDFTITTVNPAYDNNFYNGWEDAATVDNFIDGVRIGSINNQNTGGIEGPVYGDYSYMTAALTACNSYYLAVSGTFTSGNDSVKAFIDYSKDGTFLNNELVGKFIFPAGIFEDSVQVNPIAITGSVRLRLICYANGEISEVEDYTLTLASGSATSIPSPYITADLEYICNASCYFLGCKGPNQFHDYGCGQPTTRNWSVPGATPSTSGIKNPVFSFPDTGFYDITLIASNSLGSDTTYSRIYISPPMTSFSLGHDTSICTGSSITLSAPSGTCYSYDWSTGATTRQISVTTAGNYSVIVISCVQSSCPATDQVSVSVAPRVFNVTGGGSNCTGTSGFPVGLSSSEAGINYQLRLNGNPVDTPVAGTGAVIGFGVQTLAGVYTITAHSVALGCNATMNGNAGIYFGQPPVVMSLSGSGSFCSGATGLTVTVDSSVSTARYQLYRNGAATGTPIVGTDSTIDFHNNPAGNYTVVATDIASLCTSSMADTVHITALPAPAIYTVTGGGTMCGGTSNAAARLSDSQIGVTYRLRRNGVLTGDTLAGTGGPISFTHLMTTGNYSIVASDTSSCVSTMSGTSNLTIITTPKRFNLTGGGSFCLGDSIENIILDSSQTGVRYQLYVDSNYVGNSQNGNGSPIDFGYQTAQGTYFVIGSNTISACWLPMNGMPTVEQGALPLVYDVTGGGHYCAGSAGALVGLSNSDTAFSYQLYLNGNVYGIPVHGVGGPLSLGYQSNPGVYTMIAQANGSSCNDTMNGDAVVFIDSVPHVQITTIYPDSICVFHGPIALSGIPPGGNFTGPGVVNDTLFPQQAGVGVKVIRYDYIDSISGCFAFAYDTAEIQPCIGVDEIDFPGMLKLYPNPADDEFTTEIFLQRETQASIIMIDELGRKVFLNNLPKKSGTFSFKVDTSSLPPGIYVLQLRIEEGVISRRVVVVH